MHHPISNRPICPSAQLPNLTGRDAPLQPRVFPLRVSPCGGLTQTQTGPKCPTSNHPGSLGAMLLCGRVSAPASCAPLAASGCAARRRKADTSPTWREGGTRRAAGGGGRAVSRKCCDEGLAGLLWFSLARRHTPPHHADPGQIRCGLMGLLNGTGTVLRFNDCKGEAFDCTACYMQSEAERRTPPGASTPPLCAPRRACSWVGRTAAPPPAALPPAHGTAGGGGGGARAFDMRHVF